MRKYARKLSVLITLVLVMSQSTSVAFASETQVLNLETGATESTVTETEDITEENNTNETENNTNETESSTEQEESSKEQEESSEETKESETETTTENETESSTEQETETETETLPVSVSGNSLPAMRSIRSTEYVWNVGKSSGAPADNAIATFDTDTGTLVISGSGSLFNNKLSSVSESSDYKKPNYYWFANNMQDNIEKIIIEDGISDLGQALFANLPNLKEVVLNSSITSIPEGTFCKCTSLTKINTDNIKYIGVRAFDGCSSLKSINTSSLIGFSSYAMRRSGIVEVEASILTSLGEYAFQYCESLKKVNMPKLTILYRYTFNNCTALEDVNLTSLTTIGPSAFTYCNSLTELSLPNLKSYAMLGSDTSLFNNSPNLKRLDLPLFEGYQGRFSIECITGCDSLEELNIQMISVMTTKFSTQEIPTKPHNYSWPNLTKLDVKDGCLFEAYALVGIPVDITKLPNAVYAEYSLYGKTFERLNLDNINGYSTMLSGANIKEIVYTDTNKELFLYFNNSSLQKIYWLGGISSKMTKSMINATAMVYCTKGSTVETWCKNNSVAYTLLSDEEADEITSGKAPSITVDSFLFDCKAPKDINIKVSLGKAPAGATGISKVLADNIVIDNTNWEFNGTDTITIKSSYLQSLSNGTHSISVEFDDGTYKTGVDINIVNSSGNNNNGTLPPEALTMITYEFYKDYPDTVIIPVKLNSATGITKLKFDNTEVSNDMYELAEGALCIKKEYLSTLTPGKYRILPTFNDINNTTIPNIMVWVYEKAADRAAPYLLQSHHIFEGKDMKLKFDVGKGDLKATNIVALVLDDDLILPNGDIKPFSNRNVISVQNKEDNVKTDAQAFTVSGTTVVLSGEYLVSLSLSAGDHLIGAIFDNTEKTTDVKKVILTVKNDNNGNNENNNKDESNNNGNNSNENSGSNNNKNENSTNGNDSNSKSEDISSNTNNKNNSNNIIETNKNSELEKDKNKEKQKQTEIASTNNTNTETNNITNKSEDITNEEETVTNKEDSTTYKEENSNREKDEQNIIVTCNCEGISWIKIIGASIIFAIANGFMLIVVFGFIIPAIKKKDNE